MNIAFCFDIDGVLTKQSGKELPEVIPGSKEALELLKAENIPYLFITNDSTLHPQKKAELLTKTITFPVLEESVLTPITSLKGLDKMKRKLIISMTENDGHILANYCGYKNYITIDEYSRQRPYLVPYLNSEPTPILYTEETDIDRIEEIVLVSMNVNFLRSFQIMLDLLVSDGIPGKDHLSPNQVKEENS